MEACDRWLVISLARSQVVPFFVVTWPPNLISSDTFKGISGPDSDEKLAPNIIDKYSHDIPNGARYLRTSDECLISERRFNRGQWPGAVGTRFLQARHACQTEMVGVHD